MGGKRKITTAETHPLRIGRADPTNVCHARVKKSNLIPYPFRSRQKHQGPRDVRGHTLPQKGANKSILLFPSIKGGIRRRRRITTNDVGFPTGNKILHDGCFPSNIVCPIQLNNSDMCEPSYKAAVKRLEAAFGTFFWTPCAAHCLDLILEHLCKPTVFPHIATTIERARTITKFIYNHGSLLNLMRKKFTGGKELCRPAATRFATNFISIQSLVLNRKALQQMFVSDEYSTSRFVQHPLSEGVVSTVLDKSFWDQCKYILNISEPLVRVLRLVDRQDKPAMGYLYEAMDKAKENIKERLKRKSDYNPIWRIIDQRWDRQLHSPLHAAGYFLNPALFFTLTFSRHSEVSRGLLACITRLVPDEGTQDLITNQIEDYREAKGMFGMKLAIRNRTKLGPVAWWNQFGGDVEELQTFAIRILSQTCSATGCERNWSTFEHIHSAKRNRLEHQRLDDFVFVHYNLKFRERDLLRKSSTTSDPLSIDHLDVMMDWVAEEEDVIFTPEDIGWENLEAPTVVVGAGDDNNDFLMPLEEDVYTGGPGGDDGGGGDDDEEEDIEQVDKIADLQSMESDLSGNMQIGNLQLLETSHNYFFP
ncbi:uncharacterized protein LOC143859407 [Tasmannia lanceolata]|uniref:uncharacterized protein LOC143859407 n=1 Tax=Tasmannia lanceolata TaxID=3420 RepID=UPI0040647234